ncbi:MAG: hypothetical protein C0424_09780 [Sphingobacteriaceae bacterium]|nr:hypothetical protein [Sphingobacteriaceae bacterium]
MGFFTLKVLRVFLIAVFIFHYAGQSSAQELSKNIPDSRKSSFLDSTFQSSKADSNQISIGKDTTTLDSTRTTSKKKGALDAEVKYQAEDSIVFNLRDKGAKLYGSAQVDYEQINLKAAIIEQNWVTNEVIALPVTDSLNNLVGKPKFKDGDQEFESRKMIYNFKSKKARISQMVTKEGESYLIGQEVKLNPDQSIYIKNTRYTTCSNTDHPHFYLNLYKAKIIPNRSVVSGPSNMVVEGIPVPLGLPFAIIPTQRGQRSGILPPEYGRSPELGFFLRNFGYYFAINDYVDLALRADVYSWGSFRLNPSTQYVKKYKYSGRVSFSYSNQQRGDRLADDFVRNRDFAINWQHQQDPKANPYGRFTASVDAMTGNFLRNNSFGSNQFLRNQLSSSISYNRNFAGKPYRLSLAARHTQNTQTRQIQLALPEGSFNVNRIEPFKRKSMVGEERWYEKIGFTYRTNFRNNINDFDSSLFVGNFLDKMDAGFQHDLPISTSAFVVAKYFQVTPALNYSERWSFRSLDRFYDRDSNRVITDTVSGFFRNYEYSFNLSVNTRLYGLKQFRTGKIAAIRHVVNPRLGYNLRPDFSAPNFGFFQEVQTDSLGNTRFFNRFERFGFGGPGGGRQGALNLNVDNNLEAKIRQRTDTGVVMKKIKIFDSFNFGASYNFAADSLRLSPVIFSGRTTFTNNFSLLFGGQLDPYARAENGQRVNQWLVDQQGKLAYLTNANLALSGSIRPKGKSGNAQRQPGNNLGNAPMPAPLDENEAREQDYLRRQSWNQFIDWTVPYSLNFNYTLNFNRSFIEGTPNTITQAVLFNGDVSLTPKWKIGYNSGYDFTNKRMTTTVINLYRDLHCWEMSFNMVPFGQFRSYTFTINAKARMLQELKLTRRRDWFDLQRLQ